MNAFEYSIRNSAELLARALYGEPLISMGEHSNVCFIKILDSAPVDPKALSNSKALIHWSYYKN